MWTQTYSGIAFDLLNPRSEDVTIEDIAHHLSMICRFAGAVDRFYSVAEHCIAVSRLVPKSLALPALLHDAHEAYTGDIPAPVKALMSHRKFYFSRIERMIDRVIADHFGFKQTLFDAKEIKRADLVMLATERKHLKAKPPKPWLIDEMKIRPTSRRKCKPSCLPPFPAECHFMDRFTELTQ